MLLYRSMYQNVFHVSSNMLKVALLHKTLMKINQILLSWKQWDLPKLFFLYSWLGRVIYLSLHVPLSGKVLSRYSQYVHFYLPKITFTNYAYVYCYILYFQKQKYEENKIKINIHRSSVIPFHTMDHLTSSTLEPISLENMYQFLSLQCQKRF